MHKIPKFIDSQPKILFWDMDEGMVLIFGVMFGIMLNARFTFIIGAIVIKMVLARMKTTGQDGFLYHRMYALGISAISKLLSRKIPRYWIKEFIQ